MAALGQPVHMKRPHAAFALTLSLLLFAPSCGPVEDPLVEDEDVGVADGRGFDAADRNDTLAARLGRPCDRDDDCASGRCAVVEGGGACVTPCESAVDCVPGWTCDPLPAVNATVCRCSGTPGGGDPDNGLDDDCDGNPDRDTARIAFWNVRSLSTQSRDANELASIAEVIGRFDAMAIAEVADGEVIGQIEQLLDAETSWSSITSDPVGNSPQSSERYAVLFRDDVFALRSSRQLPELTTRSGAAFEREPFLAVLAAHAGADFALTVVHVVWGSGETPRIDEVRTLAEYYEMAWNNDRDVLILGDLNRNSGDPESIGWLEAEVGLVDTTDSFPPTKVDSNNTYDHVLLNPVETWEYGGVHGVELFDEEFFPGDADTASQAMSDHRPVWIEVAVGFDDD